jgi:AbrB family looped-hinge helix DNA binding protein
MLAVKVGVSRQIVIPKRLSDQLDLAPGDYLEVRVYQGSSLLMTPMSLVDKRDLRAAKEERPLPPGDSAQAEEESRSASDQLPEPSSEA